MSRVCFFVGIVLKTILVSKFGVPDFCHLWAHMLLLLSFCLRLRASPGSEGVEGCGHWS